MFEKIIKELVDGKKTYSVTGFVAASNIFAELNFPATVPEWTEIFNMLAAFGAVILVVWRLSSKFIKWMKNKK